MGSSLAQASMEDNLCVNFQSFNTCYKDTGLWGIYFVCDRLKAYFFLEQLQRNWQELCSIVGPADVNRAKNILKTNISLQLDGSTPICEDIGRQMLCYGRRIPIAEMEARIDAVDVDAVKKVCQKYIYDRCPVFAAVGPIEAIPDYNLIRNRMRFFGV